MKNLTYTVIQARETGKSKQYLVVLYYGFGLCTWSFKWTVVRGLFRKWLFQSAHPNNENNLIKRTEIIAFVKFYISEVQF